MADSTLAKRARGRTWAGWMGPHPALIGVLVLLATVLLLALAFTVHTMPVDPIDLTITRDVQAFHPGWFDLLMRAVGEPGYPPQVYAVVAWIFFVLYAFGLKWEAMAHAFATIGIGIVGLAIKYPVDRARPSPNLVYVANPALDGGKFSFPAGHVESFVAIFGFLIFLLIVLGRPSWLRTLEIAFFAFLIALIGISRLYTGEHWLSDVIGGYLSGSVWLIATIRFYQWGKDRFFVNERGRRRT